MYKVVIVDDEPLFRKNFIAKINWDGFRLQVSGEAENGVDALRLIRETAPDIVFTDIKMPAMDGLALLREVNGTEPRAREIKFILLSSYSDFEFSRRAIQCGAFDYLLKPVKEEEIAGVLMRAVDALNAARQNDELLLNVELRHKLVGRYESLLIHFTESRDIQHINKCIDEFYEAPDLFDQAEACYNSCIEFALLVHKICEMFKLETAEILPQHLGRNGAADGREWRRETARQTVREMFGRMINRLICSKNSEGRKIIAEVLSFMAEHYALKISLEQIAKRYFINPSYFSQLFKNTTGQTFSNYLIGLRLQKAQELLRLGSLKVYQVAAMVGYDDDKHISQIFKKYIGQSPSEYMENLSGRS